VGKLKNILPNGGRQEDIVLKVPRKKRETTHRGFVLRCSRAMPGRSAREVKGAGENLRVLESVSGCVQEKEQARRKKFPTLFNQGTVGWRLKYLRNKSTGNADKEL